MINFLLLVILFSKSLLRMWDKNGIIDFYLWIIYVKANCMFLSPVEWIFQFVPRIAKITYNIDFSYFFFRERQSPKEVAKKSDQKSPNILEKSTPKSSSLDSEFDLLSLSKPNNTPSAKTTVVQEPAKSSAVTDLLGLGGKPISRKFLHFFCILF